MRVFLKIGLAEWDVAQGHTKEGKRSAGWCRNKKKYIALTAPPPIPSLPPSAHPCFPPTLPPPTWVSDSLSFLFLSVTLLPPALPGTQFNPLSAPFDPALFIRRRWEGCEQVEFIPPSISVKIAPRRPPPTPGPSILRRAYLGKQPLVAHWDARGWFSAGVARPPILFFSTPKRLTGFSPSSSSDGCGRVRRGDDRDGRGGAWSTEWRAFWENWENIWEVAQMSEMIILNRRTQKHCEGDSEKWGQK